MSYKYNVQSNFIELPETQLGKKYIFRVGKTSTETPHLSVSGVTWTSWTDEYNIGSGSVTSNFSITSTGSNSYIFNGAGTRGSGIDENPTLYLTKGRTYNFNVSTSSGHLFQIIDNSLGFDVLASGYGITNNTGIYDDTITWEIAYDTPTSGLYYQCANHTGMKGDIILTDYDPPRYINGLSNNIDIQSGSGIIVTTTSGSGGLPDIISISADESIGQLFVFQDIEGRAIAKWGNTSSQYYTIETIEIKDSLDQPVVDNIYQSGAYIYATLTVDDTSTDITTLAVDSGTNYIDAELQNIPTATVTAPYTGQILIPTGFASGDAIQIAAMSQNSFVASTTGISTGTVTITGHGEPFAPVFNNLWVDMGGDVHVEFFINTIPSTRGFYDFVDLEIEVAEPDSSGNPGTWESYETLQATGSPLVDFADGSGLVEVLVDPTGITDGSFFIRARTTNPLGSSDYVEYGD